MIKILTDTRLIDSEGWDFPLEELDYLSEEYDGEAFVIDWLIDDSGPRFCETFMTEEEVQEHEAGRTADQKQGDTFGVLRIYSRLLVNEIYSVFGTDEMQSLEHFYSRYRKLFFQTGYRERPEAELREGWDELKRDILDNIECLIAGSIGL